MHHSLTSTYIPNFIKIKETFFGRTERRMYRWVDGHLRPTLLGRLKGVDLKIGYFGDVLPSRSLGLVLKNYIKHDNMHP